MPENELASLSLSRLIHRVRGHSGVQGVFAIATPSLHKDIDSWKKNHTWKSKFYTCKCQSNYSYVLNSFLISPRDPTDYVFPLYEIIIIKYSSKKTGNEKKINK